MQDIVFKLVPDLQEGELFYLERKWILLDKNMELFDRKDIDE